MQGSSNRKIKQTFVFAEEFEESTFSVRSPAILSRVAERDFRPRRSWCDNPTKRFRYASSRTCVRVAEDEIRGWRVFAAYSEKRVWAVRRACVIVIRMASRGRRHKPLVCATGRSKSHGRTENEQAERVVAFSDR